eukprot:g10263.t1
MSVPALIALLGSAAIADSCILHDVGSSSAPIYPLKCLAARLFELAARVEEQQPALRRPESCWRRRSEDLLKRTAGRVAPIMQYLAKAAMLQDLLHDHENSASQLPIFSIAKLHTEKGEGNESPPELDEVEGDADAHVEPIFLGEVLRDVMLHFTKDAAHTRYLPLHAQVLLLAGVLLRNSVVRYEVTWSEGVFATSERRAQQSAAEAAPLSLEVASAYFISLHRGSIPVDALREQILSRGVNSSPYYSYEDELSGADGSCFSRRGEEDGTTGDIVAEDDACARKRMQGLALQYAVEELAFSDGYVLSRSGTGLHGSVATGALLTSGNGARARWSGGLVESVVRGAGLKVQKEILGDYQVEVHANVSCQEGSSRVETDGARGASEAPSEIDARTAEEQRAPPHYSLVGCGAPLRAAPQARWSRALARLALIVVPILNLTKAASRNRRAVKKTAGSGSGRKSLLAAP